MVKIGRNSLCPCGSGQKYKKCCGTKTQSKIIGLKPGIRMKGGVRFDPISNSFIVIVHIWDNVDCEGEPTEWRAPEEFQSEEAAMNHYKIYIHPHLQKMMTEITNKKNGTKVIRRE
ncbi:MAG: SEC-C metal-binding domain-containing protein [bacterium]